MFTVTTPTMWRCPGVFLQAINNYIRSDFIDEIIIINNDVSKTPSWPELRHHKIRLLNQENNIFVNPAWNLGVAEARNDKICIANDDIIFDMRLFAKMYDRVISSNGVHGIITGEAIFGHPPTTDGSIDFDAWYPGLNIHSFGQLMFIHKSNWLPIIDGLNIYYGDDFIFHSQLCKGLTNYRIYNIHFFSPMAQTTSDKSLTEGFHEREYPIWANWFQQTPIM